MGPIESKIVARLTQALSPTKLEIKNESESHKGKAGSESHFEVLVVSAQFAGLSKVDRHKKVYQILGLEMKFIHMLALKTMTPAEWEIAGKGTFSAPKHS